MSPRSVAMLVAVTAMAVQTVSSAAPAPQVQSEIAFLLEVVGTSSCEFNRNGIWYDAKKAQDHLRDKYKYLLRRDLIDSTEDFIDRAASRSSITGRPYLIKCDASSAVRSQDWLRAALARYRRSAHPG